MQAQANRTAEAKATHAALVERTSALAVEVRRLEDASARARDAGSRPGAKTSGAPACAATELQEGIVASEARLDEGVRTFDEQRERVREAEERSQTLRSGFDEQDGHIREAREALEGVRAEALALRSRARDGRGRPRRTWRRRASSRCRPRSTRSRPKSRRSSATACWPARSRSTIAPEAAEIEDERRARPPDEVEAAAEPEAGAGRTSHDAGRDGRRPARQGRAHGRRQHDGHRSVRRPRVAPRLPDHAAQGPRRRHRRRPARRSGRSTRRPRSASAKRSPSSTRTSSTPSRRSSAAAAPA